MKLVSNSIKYAFVDHKSGNIKIEVNENKGHYRLTVDDNGVGLPPEFSF